MMRRRGPSLSVEEMSAAASAIIWKEPPRWLPAALHSIVYKDYRLLLIGQISNSLARWMDMIARPILIIALTGSAVQLGLITLARGLPMMALGPFAGLLADRKDRRLLMLIAKSLSLVGDLAFAALIFSGKLELWHIYVAAIFKSLVGAFGYCLFAL